MQYLITILSVLAVSSFAAAAPNCNEILPACGSGSIIGQTACQCPGQIGTCDLWSCPGGARMVCGQQSTGCVFI